MSLFTILMAFVVLGILIVLVKWPESGLVLLTLVPILKMGMMERVSFFAHFDMTLLAVLIVSAQILGRWASRGTHDFWAQMPWRLMLVTLAMAVLIFGSLLYTSAPAYGFAKAWRFGVLTVFCFVSPIALLTRGEDINRLFVALLLGAAAVSAFGIIFPTTTNLIRDLSSRSTVMDASPLGVAQSEAYGFIIAIALLLTRRRWGILSWPMLAGIALLCAVAVLYTGSRGPIVGMVLCVLVMAFWLKGGQKLAWAMWLCVFGFIGIPLALALTPRSYTNRVVELLGHGEIGTSAEARLDYARFVLRNASISMLGHGSGSFAVDIGGDDARGYPHNLLLEMWYECGLVGLGLSSAFVIGAGVMGWRLRKSVPEHLHLAAMLAFLLYFFCLCEAMKSGDMSDNRYLWLYAGVAAAVCGIARREGAVPSVEDLGVNSRPLIPTASW